MAALRLRCGCAWAPRLRAATRRPCAAARRGRRPLSPSCRPAHSPLPHPNTNKKRSLAAALAVLDAERGAAAGAYAAERYQTQQLAEHQARQLAEQTHRAEAAEAALATTRAALDEARASAAAAAAAAAERRAAEAAAAAAALTDQRDAVAQAKAFLAERSGLQQREQALQAELDEERRAAVKKQMVRSCASGAGSCARA